ncbi:hypothetical protein [Saccharothrix deserti]|uniref:hypothetical protein n=1 Tax=Saccharothrix deserti TaxID=2593674 RepID=UPI00131B8676|nr:hypothetical protein [Saccharothrix deserti]
MPLIPNSIPGIVDPRAVGVLQHRWTHTRTLLLWSVVVLPGTMALICVVFAALAGTPWAVLPALAAAAMASGFAWWLRRRGLAEPPSWLSTSFLVSGGQLLLGVIPGGGLAMSSASGGGQAAAVVLFALAWACAASSCLTAHRAHRSLMTPVVPELGATDFTLSIAVRFAITTADLASARLDVAADGLTWSARLHRGRSSGPRAEHSVSFADLRDIVAITLPPQPTLQPWLVLPDGTVLVAPPGPAVVMRTVAGEWMVPVHDALLVRDLVLTRRNRWANRPTDR